MAQSVETTQDEFSRRYGAAVKVVGAVFLLALLLVALACAGVLVGPRYLNPTLDVSTRVAIVFLGVGAVVFRRTRFSSMRLQDIAALRGQSGLLETLQTTTVAVALMGGAIAVLGFFIATAWKDMLWLGGIAVVVLLYAYPRRSAWARVIRATADDEGPDAQVSKGILS